MIGRFALGRSWRSATPAQRQEYQKLFAAWTINDYERLLGANMDGRLTIIGVQPIGWQDALVHTRIDPLNGTPVEMDLRVRGSDVQMKKFLGLNPARRRFSRAKPRPAEPNRLETEWYLEAKYSTVVFGAERQRHWILVLLRYLKQRQAEFAVRRRLALTVHQQRLLALRR